MLVFLSEYFFYQFAIQTLISLSMIILLQQFRPIKNRFDNNLETFTEFTQLCLITLLLGFALEKGDETTLKKTTATVILVIIGIYVSVHLIRLVFSTVYNFRMCVLKKCYKNRKAQNKKK